MGNDLKDGYWYFLENEGDWVPTVADIDLASNFTEGIDYCKFKFPKQWTSNEFTGIKGDFASGGKGFMDRTFRRGYIIEGIARENYDDMANIRKFVLSDDHTDSDPASYVPYYLIMRRSVSDYVPFYDKTGTQRSYLKGAVPNKGLKIVVNEAKNQTAIIHFTFMGLW